jgi:hypothetical protein
VTDRFQDGRRRHVVNSGACNKMGNYNAILMQIRIQTKKSMPSSEIRKPEAWSSFKMAAVAILLTEVNAIKWAITTRFR